MMTSSNGNIFRVTDPLCGKFPVQKQWRGALMFSLICAWINGWVNRREAGDLRRHRAHYDVTVMLPLICWCHGPLTRYVNLRMPHAPGMPRTFSPPPRVGDTDLHHGTCVTHVPWCMPGSLTSSFLWSRRRGETFPTFPAHAQHAILRIW